LAKSLAIGLVGSDGYALITVSFLRHEILPSTAHQDEKIVALDATQDAQTNDQLIQLRLIK
jgi:hypothetical protein